MPYMRAYSDFWRGKTGRAIARENALTRCVAFYLFTCQSANSEGLYRIHLPDVAYEVGSGATEQAVELAIRRLADLNFARYDHATEFVWVVKMAWYQFQPLPLHAADNRVRGIERWYRNCAPNPFLGPWYDLYAGPDALCLAVERRDDVQIQPYVLPSPSLPLSLPSPSEGASEALQLLPDPPKARGPEGFEAFWALYPKKRAKARCEQEWRRQKITAQDVAVMVDKLSHPYEYWPEWMQGKILDPVNFLKHRRWLDEAAPKAAPISERAQQTIERTETIRRMMREQLADAEPKGLLSDG